MSKIKAARLGRITEGEVELAPLTILVGKNNTGKSYLANLIWAISNISMLSTIDGKRSPRPAWLSDLMRPFDAVSQRSYIASEAEVTRVFKSGQSELNRKTEAFLSSIFAHDGFSDTKITLEPDDFPEIEITVSPSAEQVAKDSASSTVSVISKVNGEVWSARYWPMFAFQDLSQWLLDQTFFDLIGTIALGREWQRFRQAVYIPAARTGLMLALPTMVESALERHSPSAPSNRPLALSQFIQRMARPADATVKFDAADVRDFITERMLFGSLKEKKGTVREYRYQPDGIDVQLPLHAVSSMITELAPLMVELGTNLYKDHIIFEEPEAHLHLEAQREMARVIARLVSSGIMVTLTTHSDTFLQQINNLMTLHGHPNRKSLMEKFGYDQADLIDPDDAKAFEFSPTDTGTQIKAVVKSTEGFVVPTLNATLMALARETVALRSGHDA